MRHHYCCYICSRWGLGPITYLMAVAPRPIKCGAELPTGSKCDEYATVTNVRYVYDRKPSPLGDQEELVLNEIHYSALCPTCEERTVIEKY